MAILALQSSTKCTYSNYELLSNTLGILSTYPHFLSYRLCKFYSYIVQWSPSNPDTIGTQHLWPDY